MRRTTRALAATIAAVATLATGAASAQAVEATRSPYVDVTLESVQDGTGHGTPAQTFVNSKNGFKIGDDSPTDGVVSSGDTVTYVERLSFQPAQRRVVTIGFDLSGAGLLENTESASQCPAGHDVKTSKTPSGCRYEVPAGVAENLTATLRLTAKDSGGVPVDNQKPLLTVSRDGGATEKHALPAETVVSTPNADFYLDNGAYDGKNLESSLGIYLRVRAKGWKGYTTTHGSSLTGSYYATLDVSNFPDNAVWKLDGNEVKASNGKLMLGRLTGVHVLNWSNRKNADATYDIHAELSSDSFGGDPDPGNGKGRDYDSDENGTGSCVGRPYANDNWSRFLTWKSGSGPKDPEPLRSGTGNDTSQTRFDDDNKNLTDGTPISWAYASTSGKVSQTVSVGATIRVRQTIMSDYTEHRTMWMNNGLSLKPGTVHAYTYGTQGKDEEVPTSEYVVEYGHDCADLECETWTDMPGADTLGIRVTPKTDSRIRYYQFDLLASDEVGATQLGVTPFFIDRVKPGLWNLKTRSAETVGKVKPADPVRWTSEARMEGLQSAHTPLSATADVCLPAGLEHVSPSGNGWDVLETKDDSCAKAYRLTLADTAYHIQNGTDHSLPTILLSGNVGITAPSGPLAASITYNVDTGAYKDITPRHMESVNTMGVGVDASDGHSNRITRTGDISTKWTRAKADPGAIQSFDWSVYNRDSQLVDGDLSTVIKLPEAGNESKGTGDCALLGKWSSSKGSYTGPEGHWSEYDRDCSDMSATLAHPVTVTDGTADVEYSTGTGLLDPSDYTWKTWNDLTDGERGKVTAVRITTPAIGGVAGAVGTISVVYPSEEGRADTWIGPSYRNGVKQSDTPWPDGVETDWARIGFSVFEDNNRDGKQDSGDSSLNDADDYFTIWKIGADGARTKMTSTWKLTSGDYHVEATGFKPDEVDSRNAHVVGQATDHYSRSVKPIASTDTTWDVSLSAGGSRSLAFGYYHPEFKATVSQKTDKDCNDDSCTVTYTTAVTNKGKDSIKTSDASMNIRLDGTEAADMEQVVSDVRFSHIWYGGAYPSSSSLSLLATDKEGKVWAADFNGTQTNRYHWTHLDEFDDYDVKALTTGNGGHYVLALLDDGTVRVLNFNTHGRDYCQYGPLPEYGAASGRVCPGDTALIKPPSGVRFTAIHSADGDGHILLLGDDGNVYAFGKGESYSPKTDSNVTDYKLSPLVKLDAADGTTPKFVRMQGLTYGNVMLWTEDGREYMYYNSGSAADGLIAGSKKQNSIMPISLPAGGPTTIRQVRTFGYYGIAILDDDGRLWYYAAQDSSTKENVKAGGWKLLSGDVKVKTIAGNETPYSEYSSPLNNSYPYRFLGEDGHLWQYASQDAAAECAAYPDSWGCGGLKPQPGLSQVDSDRTFDEFTPVANLGSDNAGDAMLDGEGQVWMLGPRYMTGITDITPVDHSGAIGTIYASPANVTRNDVEDGDRRLTATLPFDLNPGDTVTYRVVRILDRGKADRTTGLQSWFDSTDTPYQGTPVSRDGKYAYDADKPSMPVRFDLSKLDTANGYITGNPTCIVGRNAHTFTQGATVGSEDSCEQSGAIIPARVLPGEPVKGSVSGIMWEDLNNNGLRDSDAEDNTRLSGQTVTLYKKDGTRVAKTTTGKDGSYCFDNLPQGEYYLWFSKPAGKWFTTPDKDDPTPESDGSSDDSDASDNMDDYGRSTVTLTIDGIHVTYSHVDAGIKHVGWIQGMPDTGRNMLLLIIIPLIMALGYEGWRRVRIRD